MQVMKKTLSLVGCLLAFLFAAEPAFAQDTTTYTRLAVMPFKNLTGDKDKSWLGEGIADTLTTELGAVRGIIIIERAQLAKVMGELRLTQSGHVSDKDAVKVGKIVSAKYVLLGSYQMAGGQVLINARLVDVEKAITRETCKVRGSFNNIFDLQDELAKKTLSWLKVTPTRTEVRKMTAAPNRNINSFEYISRAKEAFLAGRTDEAEKLIRKALEADPSNPSALMQMGRIQERRGQYRAALDNYTAAAGIFKKKNDDSNYAEALRYIGNVHYSQGRYDEALKYCYQALEINRRIGRDPEIARNLCNIGLCYKALGNYSEARRAWEEAIAIYEKIGDYKNAWTLRDNINKLPR